jgi:hypothetical protein
MANSKLLKEAIADAKAVKETALANAKLALEEAFTPRLQSILSQKLRAEAEEVENDDAEKMQEELDSSDIGASDGKEPSGFDANTDLSVGVKSQGGQVGSELSDYKKVKDLNEEEDAMDGDKDAEIAELKARLAELEGEDDEMDMSDEFSMDNDMEDDGEDYDVTGDEMEVDDEDEDDMDLEAIIRELEQSMADGEGSEDETPEEGMYEAEDEKEMDAKNENLADGSEAGTDKGEDPKVVVTNEEEDKEDVIDLEEILREMEQDMMKGDKEKVDEEEDKEEMKKDLKEAYNTIKSLQKTINEVNLLNAKLLFANKLFRAHNMTNEQKVKVIETLDRTKSVREVKLVYSTLAENFKYSSNKVAKKSITEGIASKVTKSTKPAAAKQVIAESVDFSNRFKKLAGIIK